MVRGRRRKVAEVGKEGEGQEGKEGRWGRTRYELRIKVRKMEERQKIIEIKRP